MIYNIFKISIKKGEKMSDSVMTIEGKNINEEPLWTIEQCAKYLNLKYCTVINKVNAGKIPFKNLGQGKRKRIIRFVPSEVKAHFGIK